MSIHLRDGLLGQPADHVLEDLLVRFVINVPDEDLSSIERVFFQVEEAQWFYTDFVRVLNPALPSMKMKSFAPKILSKCPLLWKWGDPADALPRFGKYKSTIPVRGIAMLNADLTKVVLLKGIESNAWSFPRGKISKDEADLECALRETREETGFDARDYVSERDVLERTIYGKNFKIYVARGVPEAQVFEPLVRNEIAEIRWFDLRTLTRKVKNTPGKFFVVDTMLKPLTRWIGRHRGAAGDEQAMRHAELRLKALMGIGNGTENGTAISSNGTGAASVNADAGRELLDILQGARPPAPALAAGPPPPQYIQMSLPQHLHSVYSGLAQMPQFFSAYGQNMQAPGQGPGHPMVAPPGFTEPRFAGAPNGQSRPAYPPAQTQAQTQTQTQSQAPPSASANSKELLSILKGSAPPKKAPAPPKKTPAPPRPRYNSNSAEELLSILKQTKPKPPAPVPETEEPEETAPSPAPAPASRPEAPAKKITLLKRDRSAPESASATLLGILGKKPAGASPASSAGTSTTADTDETPQKPLNANASAEILGILKKAPTPKASPQQDSTNPTGSAELLSVLHQKAPTPRSEPSTEQNLRPIRLAKRGNEESFKNILYGEPAESAPPSQPVADLSAGNQILRLINQEPVSTTPEEPSAPEEPEESPQDTEFEDFENFENFDDFDDMHQPPSHIYDLIHNTLDGHSDFEEEEEEDEDAEDEDERVSPHDAQKASATFMQMLNGNKPAQNHQSTYQNTYGLPNLNAFNNIPAQQPKRSPSTNGADILSLLRRN